MDTPYARDPIGGKVFGVCSGLARSIDYDPTLIRGLAVVSLIFFGPITLMAYLLAAWLAD